MLINFIISLIISFSLQASDCKLSEVLAHPDILENAQFWEDFGKLKSQNLSKQAMADILEKKYQLKIETKEITSPAPTISGHKVSLTHNAQKELDGYQGQKHITERVDEFAKLIKSPGGIHNFKETHSWNLEKMPEYGKNHWSVRINSGYRILFTLINNEAKIIAIDKSIGH